MILEALAIGGLFSYSYKKATKEIREKKNFEADVKHRWSTLMDGIGKTTENRISQPYEILKIIKKHYGYDMLISVPMGKTLKEFRKLLPHIEIAYKSNVICEYADDFTSMYMRVHNKELDISKSDEIKFKWYSFFQSDNVRNNSGETYKLKKSKKIVNPNNEEVVIGYRYEVEIPNGLTFDDLKSKTMELSKIFGLCEIKYNNDDKKVICEIILDTLSDDEKFVPIKCKPHELYVGMTNSFKPIFFDFKKDPNGIWGGKSGTGKTVSYISALINLCTQYTENDFELYITMLSDKQDLRVFKNTKHCKYYSREIRDTYKMLLYLSNKCKERNRLFEGQRKFISNIYEYNDLHKQYKLPLIFFCVDEIASFSKNGTETNDEEIKLKEKCSALVWKLAREGRSCGIYSILSTQRGDVKNLDANIKGNLGNTLSFYFPNIPSAMTIIGDGELAKEVVRLRKSREFICVADEVYRGKTLHLTNADMERLLEGCTEKNHKHLQLKPDGTIKDTNKTNEKDKNKTKFSNLNKK